MEKLRENDMMEYLAILRSFESKKRLVCEEFSENVSVNLPTMLSKRLKKKSKKINKVLNGSQFPSMTTKSNSLHV